MRFSVGIVLAGLTAMVAAQVSLSDLPQCAQGCVGSSINVPGCSGLDIKCICQNAGYLSGLGCCVAKACNPSDQAKALSFAASLCSTAGVSVTQSVGCASSSSSSSKAPSSSASPASSAGSSSAGTTSTTSTSSTTGTSATTGTTSTAPSSSPNASSSPLAVSTNAAMHYAANGMGFAGFVAALLALF